VPAMSERFVHCQPLKLPAAEGLMPTAQCSNAAPGPPHAKHHGTVFIRHVWIVSKDKNETWMTIPIDSDMSLPWIALARTSFRCLMISHDISCMSQGIDTPYIWCVSIRLSFFSNKSDITHCSANPRSKSWEKLP
jgi:hypothetical protein